MLKLTIPGDELFDERTNTFSTVNDVTIELEHSLVSLSKWESKYQKPFLSPGSKPTEEIFFYVECMILTPDFSPEVFRRFTQKNIDDIQSYIDSKQSATTFGDMPEHKGRTEVITSELIYFWMVGFNIPFECQYWHLNRLFSLIRICNVKNSKPKKLSKQELARRNHELNQQRRAQLGTKG